MKRIVLSLVVLGLVALGVAGIVLGFPPRSECNLWCRLPLSTPSLWI
jgi:hypothetical protein